MATYTVQTGDTLFAIAQRFGTTVEALIQANNITNPNVIFVGQVLTIPGDGDTGGTNGDNGGDNGLTGGRENEVSRRIDNLTYTIFTDQSIYDRGENVVITLIKTNTSSRNITLRYRTAQRYEFLARRGTDQTIIWRWSRGRFFAQATSTVTLRPRESQVFRVVWNQRNNQGQQVVAGLITIEGFNVAEGLANRGISTTVRIRAVGPTPTPTPTPTPRPTPCPDINVLVNPGFERWPSPTSDPTGWNASNVARTTISRSGNYAAEMGSVRNARAVLSQRADIEAGRIYDLVWWARENVLAGRTGRFILFVEIFYYDRAGRFVGRTEPRYSQENIPEGSYQRYSLSTGRVPAGARTAEVRFTFEPSAGNSSRVKIDDVELRCRF